MQELGSGFAVVDLAIVAHPSGATLSGRIVNMLSVGHRDLTLGVYSGGKELKEFTLNQYLRPGGSAPFTVVVPTLDPGTRSVGFQYQRSMVAYGN